MSYAAQADLEFAAGGAERFLQLTDWNDDGQIDADVVTRGLSKADAFIEPYLRLRYKTPIANPSESLKQLAADEAIFQIRKARGLVAITKEDLDDREQRIRQLEDYRDGKLRADEPLPAPSTAVRSAFVENENELSREDLEGMW